MNQHRVRLVALGLAMGLLANGLLATGAAATDLCGDMDADGVLEAVDEDRIRLHRAGLSPALWVREEMRCNVAVDGDPGLPGDAIANGCSILDWVISQRTRLGAPGPTNQQLCSAGSTGACCSAHGGIGCDDTEVAECVCTGIPGCCGTLWHAGCAAAVTALGCGSCGGSPSLRPIADVTLFGGSPLHVPLNGHAPPGEVLSYSVSSSDPVVVPSITAGNRNLRISVADMGDLDFQLFEGLAQRATDQIITLSQSGFHAGIIFHRVIDNFVIQGGDPTGTGSGGSPLGDFDDQFHVDLHHNRTGVLSMAKGFDDTNDSQFFVTEGPQRHLDYNHTVFGQLLVGEDVRDRISNVATDPNGRPLVNVAMDSTSVYTDGENAVLVLKAAEGAMGSATITVTAQAQNLTQVQRSFAVSVFPDTVDGHPFLADIPPISTTLNTQVQFQLQAINPDGGGVPVFLDQTTLSFNGLPVPVIAHPNLVYSVDFVTGLVTVTPQNGLLGTHNITVATGAFLNAIDYQVVPITITP